MKGIPKREVEMPSVINPTTTIVKVVPRDGAIEITLNINITVDGKVTASSEQAQVEVEKTRKTEHFIPEFKSGKKVLNFSKE